MASIETTESLSELTIINENIALEKELVSTANIEPEININENPDSELIIKFESPTNPQLETHIEEALLKLLKHSEGTKALLDLQMKDFKISEEALASINSPEFNEAQKQTLIDHEKNKIRKSINVDSQINELMNALTVAKDLQAKQQAWQAILDVVLKAYYVARDDTSKFKTVRDMVETLAVVVDAFVAEFDGKLADNKVLAALGAQAFFRVANCYGMDDQAEVCSQWHNKAEKFILANGLEKTQELAVLYNLRAGEISRRFPLYNPDGSLNSDPFPVECIFYFQKALDLHTEIGSTLKETAHMRHVLMCLASVKSQELRHRLHTSEMMTPRLSEEIAVESEAIFQLLDDLKPYIKNDGYRMGGTLQIESLLFMLNGDVTTAIEAAKASLKYMPKKQTGQYSNALNNAADIHVFMTAVLYLSIDIIDNLFQTVEDHPYAQMAKKIHSATPFKIAPYNSQEEILDIATSYLLAGMACYVESYRISHDPDKPERTYADQAQKALDQLGVKEKYIEMLYFDDDIENFLKHCKTLSVAPGEPEPEFEPELEIETEVDSSKSLITYFTDTVKQAANDIYTTITSFSPFGSSSAKPTSKPGK